MSARSVLPAALMALAGVLLGGAWSMHRQGAGKAMIAVLGVLCVAALAGGVLWLIPGGE